MISVPYHTKTLRFYNQLGLSDRSKMLKDVEKGDVYNLLNKNNIREIENLNHIIKNSRVNYNLLEKFIKEIN